MGRYIPNAFNLLVVIYVALGSTACSYGLAVIGSTIGQPTFYTSMKLATTGEPGYGRTAQLIGAFNGVSSAGSALGALHNAWSADRFSRKYTIQVGAIILIIGAALCGGSVNVGMFIAARFIAGWGVGILISVIPMYQSEVSTPETRGFMVSMHGIMFAIGYSLSAWIGFGVYFISASGSTSTFPWRFPLAFQAVPAVLLLLGSPWLPFSPRWLMQQGRYDEAREVIRRLHARKDDPLGHHEQADREFYQMRRQLEMDRAIKATVSQFEIFKTAPNRRRALVATILMWGNQFTGVLIIANYAVILFTQLGLSGYMPLLLLGVWVSASFPGNVFTALCVDRFGRRRFLLIGISGILVALICECALEGVYVGTTNKAGQRAAIFFIYFFILFWSSFIDATQYLYLSEIFPTHIRGQGVAVGMFNLFAASIVILVAGPIALTNIGYKFYFVLIIPTAFYLVAIYFLFPETMQRSLEDINQQFGEKVAVHYFGATAEEEEEYRKAMGAEGDTSEAKAGLDHVEIGADKRV